MRDNIKTKKCPVCGSTEHIYCSKSPERRAKKGSPEDKLLKGIFGDAKEQER